MYKNQRGFSVGQVVLVILVLGIVIGVGYFVFNRNKSNDVNVSQPAVTANETTEPVKEEIKDEYFPVEGWDVKFKKGALTQNPEFEIVSDNIMYLSTSLYREKTGGECMANGSTGYVARGKAGYDYQKDYNGISGESIEKSSYTYEDEETGDTVVIKPRKAGEYYYIWIGPQAACYDPNDTNISKAVEGYQQALREFVATAEEL